VFLFLFLLLLLLFFPLCLARETACKREKKAFFIPVRMNSSSLSWASYCSSTLDFHPFEESDVSFIWLIFLFLADFQPNTKSNANALNQWKAFHLAKANQYLREM
jgi:hypothetical protein